MNNVNLFKGECFDILNRFQDNSLDSLVTDPPAGISFMGKAWDDDKGGRKQWIGWMSDVMKECLRVLKPGAHGLVWAIPRTSHWTAAALEDAGFEIRDVVTHIFGSGFPKSLDISKAIDKATGAEREILSTKPRPSGLVYNHSGVKTLAELKTISEENPNKILYKGETAKSIYSRCERLMSEPMDITGNPSTPEAKKYQGWGTALKPASEHWILVRKPISEKTVAANTIKYRTGGINIDASRIKSGKDYYEKHASVVGCSPGNDGRNSYSDFNRPREDGSSPQGRFPANLILDEEAAKMLDGQTGILTSGEPGTRKKDWTGYQTGLKKLDKESGFGDSGGASRFFYCAKASKADKSSGNIHPTVKSTKLMSYLIKLITPVGGVVLDPFMGSGSTGVAAVKEGFNFIGIEKDPEYMQIATARIDPCLFEGKSPSRKYSK